MRRKRGVLMAALLAAVSFGAVEGSPVTAAADVAITQDLAIRDLPCPDSRHEWFVVDIDYNSPGAPATPVAAVITWMKSLGVDVEPADLAVVADDGRRMLFALRDGTTVAATLVVDRLPAGGFHVLYYYGCQGYFGR